MVIVGKVGVPRQMVITEDPLAIPDKVTKAGLKLPLGIYLVQNADTIVPLIVQNQHISNNRLLDKNKWGEGVGMMIQ